MHASLFSSFMSTIKKLACTTIVLGCAATGATAWAQEPALSALNPNAPGYQTCLKEIDINPQGAYEQAAGWSNETGEAAARHCEGLALIKIGLKKEGAKILTSLAANPETGNEAVRTELYTQAGNAWVEVPDLDKAFGTFASAFALKSEKPWIRTELFIARARAHSAAGTFDKAESDLTAALEILPFHLDAVVLRAGTRRELADPVGALADIEFVLAADPANPDATVERGLLKLKFYDPEGAKKDFDEVIRLYPKSKAAARARNGLNKLSVRGIGN